MKLLIIGPQASGKGTQADLIAKRLNVPHLSSGDMLRELKRAGTPLGAQVAALMDKGTLVPDEMVWQMVKTHLDVHPQGWMLDGYPRTEAQARTLDAFSAPAKVLVLEVPDEICVERIAGRRVCSSCGKDYHVKYKPPKKEGICDLDGAALVFRADDNEAAVRKRLADYHTKTAPLVSHYDAKVVRVNGNQGIQEVFAEIRKKLGI